MLPELPATYVDHVVAPRGLGDVCDPNAAGEVGSMVGGLGVRVSLRYECTDNNGAVIKDACGRAFGGSAPVGPLSWLLESLEGRSWDEACAITPGQVLDALCEGDRNNASNGTASLPEAVERGAEFVVRALRRALGVAAHGMPADPGGDGVLVCRCIGVGDRRIRREIMDGALDPDVIGKRCGAGTGCGSCRPDLLALIHEQTAAQAAAPDERLHPAARIALARAGPLLGALGLTLLAARVEGDTVIIRTGEPDPGALLSPRSAAAIVRQVLRETVCDDIQVAHE